MQFYRLEHFPKQEIVTKIQKYLAMKRINQIHSKGESLQNKNNQCKSCNLKAKKNRKQKVKFKSKVK
jgi:hypothetical protein